MGSISARFPKSAWRMLDIENNLIEKGANGPVATTRLENMREGMQECEARVFIDKALLDPVKRAKLSEPLAKQCQDLLDERWRNLRRSLSTLRVSDSTGRKWHRAPFALLLRFSPILGNFWYVSTDWEDQTVRLYELAAQVEAKIGGQKP